MTTRKQIEQYLESFYGDNYGNMLPSAKITHVADYIQDIIERQHKDIQEIIDKYPPRTIENGYDSYEAGYNMAVHNFVYELKNLMRI